MTPTLADLQHARQQVALEQHRRRYLGDAWAWVAECVWTVDELDPESPVKPFPVAVCIACARYLGHCDRAACPGWAPRPAVALESGHRSEAIAARLTERRRHARPEALALGSATPAGVRP